MSNCIMAPCSTASRDLGETLGIAGSNPSGIPGLLGLNFTGGLVAGIGSSEVTPEIPQHGDPILRWRRHHAWPACIAHRL